MTLTPREQEVLALVAAGRSNAEIAALLVISPKTLEAHIGHIRKKSGFTSLRRALLAQSCRDCIFIQVAEDLRTQLTEALR